jgi:hypothetical protein
VLRQGVFQVVVGLVLAAIAAQYSLTAVLITQIIRGVLLTGYNFFDMHRFTDMRLREIMRSMAPPYIATAVMAVAMIAARIALTDQLSPLHLLLALIPIGSIAYIMTILIGVRLRIWPDFLEAIRRLLPERLRGLLPV